MKLCGGTYGCGKMKKNEEFYYNKTNKSYSTYCKACSKIYMKNNKEYEEYVTNYLKNLDESNGLKRADIKTKKEFLVYKKGTSKLLAKLEEKKQRKKPKGEIEKMVDWYKKDAEKMVKEREKGKKKEEKVEINENSYSDLLLKLSKTHIIERIEKDGTRTIIRPIQQVVNIEKNISNLRIMKEEKEKTTISEKFQQFFYRFLIKFNSNLKKCNKCGKIKKKSI